MPVSATKLVKGLLASSGIIAISFSPTSAPRADYGSRSWPEPECPPHKNRCATFTPLANSSPLINPIRGQQRHAGGNQPNPCGANPMPALGDPQPEHNNQQPRQPFFLRCSSALESQFASAATACREITRQSGLSALIPSEDRAPEYAAANKANS
ncbi:Uncharacterised protein [Cedecea neteri]|uniref:Uncharacterized protein n=1 Tax=Cedecea neteri TaxID=158822 RepID=A0A2X2SZ16_9ENTR|nr:Uncharacterised protein [Cedecea neteri]